MSGFSWPRFRVLSLIAALAVPLAACECSDDWGDSQGLGRPHHDRSKPWPGPTPPNADAQRDAGVAPDLGGGTTNTIPGGSSDAGAPPRTDASAPPPRTDAAPPPSTDASAPDARTCPAHGCASAPVCQFDNQCGAEARCRDGFCERGCAATLDCGTGRLCEGGFCVASEAPGGQCVYDRDCGAAATCINGFCHAHCTADSTCSPTRDRCLAGICRPDVGPQPQCRASTECPDTQECINAVCRTQCVTDVECCAGSSGSFCRAGVCVTAHEAAPECQRRDQCGSEASCIDGVCAPP